VLLGPFGEPLRATGAVAKANPFRFSTKYCDEETGLVYYGYRYYQPLTAKWLTRDPIGEIGGINLTNFVFNYPTTFIDKLGLSVLSPSQKKCATTLFVSHNREAMDVSNELSSIAGLESSSGCITVAGGIISCPRTGLTNLGPEWSQPNYPSIPGFVDPGGIYTGTGPFLDPNTEVPNGGFNPIKDPQHPQYRHYCNMAWGFIRLYQNNWDAIKNKAKELSISSSKCCPKGITAFIHCAADAGYARRIMGYVRPGGECDGFAGLPGIKDLPLCGTNILFKNGEEQKPR
jgi:RHS repeat-associated protein